MIDYLTSPQGFYALAIVLALFMLWAICGYLSMIQRYAEIMIDRQAKNHSEILTELKIKGNRL